MQFLKIGAMAILGLSLSGCVSTNGVSTPVSFPSAPQYMPKSAAHWKLMADDVTSQIQQSLTAQDQRQTPIYLEPPLQSTPFEQNFLPMLRASLLSQGLIVHTQPQQAATLKVQVNQVSHVATYRAGTLSLLGGGLLVLRDILTHDSIHLNKVGAVAVAVAADIAMTNHRPPPELELILSISLHKDHRFLTSTTQIYYLQSEDQLIYQLPPAQKPTGRTFTVMGSGANR
jgi:hypothetical protein